MKTILISYSATGNNYKLSKEISDKLSIDHVDAIEPYKKITFGIIFKHIFNKIPNVIIDPKIIDKYETEY